MPKLQELVGEEIQLFLSDGTLKDDPEHNDEAKVKLVEVEQFGIWIESQMMNRLILSRERRSLARTPIFFVPFSQILFIAVSDDYPLLSPEEFGLEEDKG